MRINRNMIHLFRSILMMTAMVLLASSCTKDKLETIYTNQDKKIDQYITNAVNKDSTIVVTYNQGSQRITYVQGEGEELQKGGAVSFYYAGYIFNGSVSNGNLFATNHELTAQQAHWELTDMGYEIYETYLGSGDMIKGLENGMEGVKAGEECEIVFSGKHGFGNDNFGMIPANSALLYKIWVIGVSND